VRTYHVEDATCLDAESGTIRHRPIGSPADVETADWLAMAGPVRVGITAGASTPNNKIGDAVARIFATRGVDPRVVVVPALGGKIVGLEIGGREWLWRSRARAQRPADGVSYAAVGDTGGIDECFPTVAPCVLPSNAARY